MAKTKAAQVVLTAKQMINQSQEEQDQILMSRNLEDGELDLVRAIQDANREISRLTHLEDKAVLDYIQNRERVEVLLNPSRNLEAKKADVATLKRILKERF